jgi:glycosyltransferase involved in cell wall biosynthesis
MRLMLDCRLPFGVGTVVRNVAPILASQVEKLIVLTSDDQLFINVPNITIERFPPRLYSIGEQVRFPYHLRHQVDLLHVPNFNVPLLWRKPLVVTINDLAHLSPVMSASWLQKTYVRFFIRSSLKRAQEILTLSEFSREEIVREFRVSPERITVGYCGVDRNLFKPASEREKHDVRSRLHLEKPFVLMVASFRPHKNVNTVLHAFHKLKSHNRVEHELVVVGKEKGFRLKENLVDLPETTARHIRHFQFLTDKELAALYSSCDLFVFPSLYEGFGLPPLEAMACGAPVLTSDRASLPEVIGDAGRLIDPLNVDLWADSMEQMLLDQRLQTDLRNRGLQQAQLFSWERVAKIYLDSYLHCLNS